MKETILIVEDEDSTRKLMEKTVKSVGDSGTEIRLARSSVEAVQQARKGDISYCALDLGLPTKVGEAPAELDQGCQLGFDVLDELLEHNPFVEVRVLSRFTDHERIGRLLSKRFLNDPRILGPLDKNHDGNYVTKLGEDVMGLGDLQATLDELNIRVVHPLERRLARKLWKLASIPWDWPTPRCVLRGESQMGKDQWAKALVKFRGVRQPCSTRVKAQAFDLGQIRDAGDGPLIALFGARNYQRIEDAPGLFEMATCHSPGGRLDYTQSNFVILSELGNLPSNCQPLLLEVLREGKVVRAGAGNPRTPIGCGFIFTTNARLEERVVSSDTAGEQDLRMDLFKRLNLTDGGWLFVPSFKEMGVKAFLGHLHLALEAEVGAKFEISPIANAIIEDAFCDEDQDLTHASIQTIVQSFLMCGSNRVDADHVQSVIRRTRKTPTVPGTAPVPGSEPGPNARTKSLREQIKEALGLGALTVGWTCDDFARACRAKHFATQEDFTAFVVQLARLAGTDRSAAEQRRLFAEAIGYPGADLPGYLGRIRSDIVKASNGVIKPLDRLKNR